MKKIKVSFLWTHDVRNSVIFKLFEKLSEGKIEFTKPDNCDLLIIGPYDNNSIKRRFLNYIKKKFKNSNIIFPNLETYSLNRKIKPLKLFITHENYSPAEFKYDFSITPNLGINDINHFRFPSWKDYIDWSHENIFRDSNVLNSKRFGSFYKIENLIESQGNKFLEKNRKFCMFTSHLNEPRKSMYLSFSKFFEVDGFGPYFDNSIKNHQTSNFFKKDVMNNYAFNLCPHNSLFPGYYEEKVPDAFLGKCLPITWADHNIQYEFNKNAFVNLLDYTYDNYKEIIYLLKDENFLRKFTDQPLLLSKPNLNEEIKFVKRIVDSL